MAGMRILLAMGFLSKLFGASDSNDPYVEIPDDLSSNGIIRMAVKSVVQELGGNCATLEPNSEDEGWVQLMDGVLNCSYPHQEIPSFLFPELCADPLIESADDYEADTYMTANIRSMDEEQITAWIERYFAEVLSVDLNSTKLLLRMEDM